MTRPITVPRADRPRPPAPAVHTLAGGRSIALGFPTAVLTIAGAIMLGFGFGPNQDLAVLSLAALVAGCVVLWRPGESPVMLLIFVSHWLAASIAVFHANWLGIDILHYGYFGGDMRTATVLSVFGVLFLAVGMRAGAGRRRPREAEAARSIALAVPLSRWFALYCVAYAVSLVALSFVWVVPGLSQLMLAAVTIRWAFYFALVYAAFARGEALSHYVLLAFGVELVSGIGSYFSDFRTVFLFTIFATLASGLRMTVRVQALLAVLVGLLLSLGVVWTSVKQEYRAFVAEGQSEQLVSVDYMTRMSKLGELVAALDERMVADGFDKMLHRLTYVEFFSVVLGVVPSQIAHENGALLADALTRPFLPRALFPDKAVIDDTARTTYYTGGLTSSSLGTGTSISIGYVGESYIDFGVYGMMAALFGIGCGYGFVYKRLARSARCGSLIGMGLASAALSTVGDLEASFTKVAGGLGASLLVIWLFTSFAARPVRHWMTRPGGRR